MSVVICTRDRPAHLRRCVQALRYQCGVPFEVIVVDSSVASDARSVLGDSAAWVRLIRLDVENLSVSRNAGIAASGGEIVAFIDDDAIPEPGWLANIVSGYDSERVGGVGTRVFDPSGFREQVNPRLLDVRYEPVMHYAAPFWAFGDADSLLVPHILGASSSFRADVLREIGGFDEEIAYFLDESEVCRRVAERGYEIRLLEDGAGVHHKQAPGVVRRRGRPVADPYAVVRSKFYVVLSDCRRRGEPLGDAMMDCERFAKRLLADARERMRAGVVSHAEFSGFAGRLLAGANAGRAAGLSAARRDAALPPAGTAMFRPFEVLRPLPVQRVFCFITRSLPFEQPGGVAQFMFDLARGFAAHGHAVHVIAEARGEARIDFDDGVWLHRIAAEPLPADFEPFVHAAAARATLAWSRAAHAEVARIAADGRVDLVVAPLWNTEGLHCILDPDLRTVLSLQTSFATFAQIEAPALDNETIAELSALERVAVSSARHVHAISHAVGDQVARIAPPAPGARWDESWLGIDDLPPVERGGGDGVTILFASRLERRKGIDVFLDAVLDVLEAAPQVSVTVIGAEVAGTEGLLAPFRPRMERVGQRLLLLGEVARPRLLDAYAAADILCVPSRYESFGLVFLEAMRAGLPIVACAVGGVPELVLDGETGLLVPPDDADAVADALRRLVGDPALRRRLGAAGRWRFEAFFSADHAIARTLDLFCGYIGDDDARAAAPERVLGHAR